MSNNENTNYEPFYNAEYYIAGCGHNYNDRDIWIWEFKRIANRIIELFNPKVVLDIGCAYGYLVEALREKGVEAYGIDISSYAISQANEEIKPYLKVMSALDDLPDDFPKKYDLVVSIEMIEHLYEKDGLKVIDKIVTYSDKILISSTDSDFDEPTHFNVQPQEYWCEKFASKGYIRELVNDFSFINPNTYYFIKRDIIKIPKLINDYERCVRIITKKYHKEQETSSRLNKDINEVHKCLEDNKEYYKNEIAKLNEQWNADKEYYQDKINGLNNIMQEQINIIKYNEYLLETIYNSRGYRVLRKFYKVRDWLLPINSYRRRFVKTIINIFIKNTAHETSSSTKTEKVNDKK